MYSVPWNPIIKILFAAYLFVHPYKDSFDSMIDGEDIQAMKKIIQPSFNSKVIGKDESLLSLMKKFDESPFRESEPNFKKIA